VPRGSRFTAIALATLVGLAAIVRLWTAAPDQHVSAENPNTPASPAENAVDTDATTRHAQTASRTATQTTPTALTAPVQPPPLPAARTPAQPALLPPADTPLAEVLDELTRRADAGELRAACRLAAELVRCSHRAALVTSINASTLGDGRWRRPEHEAVEEQQRAALVTANRVCAGVAPERIAEAPHRLMDAADLGHPGARAWAAVHGADEAIRHLLDAPDVAERWQQNVVRWAIASLEAGDRSVGANWAANAGAVSIHSPIARLLEQDPTLALALLRYRSLRAQRDGTAQDGGLAAAHIAAALPADAIAVAESTAQRWVAAMGPLQPPSMTVMPADRLMNRCDEP
jgi:hypothetical protein